MKKKLAEPWWDVYRHPLRVSLETKEFTKSKLFTRQLNIQIHIQYWMKLKLETNAKRFIKLQRSKDRSFTR